MLNLKQQNKIVDLCVGMLFVMLGFEILFSFEVVTNWLSNLAINSGAWSWTVLGVLQFLQVIFVPMPSSFITLTSMKMYPDNLYALYGFTLAVIMFAVVVTYLIGRKWGKKVVVWCAGSEDEYDKWLRVLKSKKTNVFYLATVLLPVFPDDVLCLMAGSIRMNFWWYLMSNILGRAIGLATFMFTFHTISNNLWTMIVMAGLIVVLLVYKIILKRRLKNESSDNR